MSKLLKLLCVALGMSLACAQAAPKATERSKQKASAEQSRAAIQKKLTDLKKDISKTESEKDSVTDLLAESDEAISNAKRSLHDLEREQADTNQKIKDLAGEREKLSGTIATQKKQLAKLLREHYLAGNEDRIKLLLSGDNPNRINRDLQMMAYVSQAQAKLIDSLRANLSAIENNQQEAQDAKEGLEEIAEDQRAAKAKLETEKSKRAGLLSSLSKKLNDKRKEASNLERDQQRMTALVNELAKLIKAQEEAAAAEKKRLEALAAAKAKADAEAKVIAAAKAKAERERLAAGGKTGVASAFKPTPIDADKAPASQKAHAALPEAKPKADPLAANPADFALVSNIPAGAFAALKGALHAPIQGKVVVKYGAPMLGSTMKWKGTFIKAAEGTEVRALAAGKVIFAGRMYGQGNQILIDHGGGYWSGYGYNESILKHVGDNVKAGEPIATAGNTGNQEESGLYFELRFKQLPIDPAGWVKF